MTPHHRKDDPPNTEYRIGPDTGLRMQVTTLCTIIAFALAAGGWCWNITKDVREMRLKIDDIVSRPDPWTGTMMQTYATTAKEWNPEAEIPNPADIQAGRRITRIKLQ